MKDESAAKALAFPGSPTIRVNGLDIKPAARGKTEIGFACRRYQGGSRPKKLICFALREAHRPMNLTEQPTGKTDAALSRCATPRLPAWWP